MSIYLIVVIAYFILVAAVSFLIRRLATRSAADYLVAGRNLGLVVCAIVVAAEWLGGLSTIGVSETAFTTGTLQPVLYNISTAIGMVIIGFTVARQYRERNVYTVSEMLDSMFGSKAKFWSAVAFTIAYITLGYVQLQTFAAVMVPLFGVDWITAVILASLIITAYTYIGGMHALAITGIIHLAVMFLGLGTALFVGIEKVNGFGNLAAILIANGSPENLYNPFSAGISNAASLILGGVLGGMAGQASIQPIFAARNAATARKAAILSAFIIAPFGVMVALLGLIAKTGLFIDPITVNPKMVLPTLMTEPLFIHPILGGIALAGILAAILSTVGPVNFAVVTIITKDIYNGVLRKGATDKELVITARRFVVIVNLITVPLAVFLHGAILDAAYVSYSIRAIGAIVILMGLYYRNWISKEAVSLSFTAGTVAIGLSILAAEKGWYDIDKTFAGVIVAIISIIVGNYWSKFKSVNQKS